MLAFKEVKNALEFARFASSDIRDALMDCIKSMDSDADEVEFTVSIETKEKFRVLNAVLNDYENNDTTSTEAPALVGVDAEEDIDSEIEVPKHFDYESERDSLIEDVVEERDVDAD